MGIVVWNSKREGLTIRSKRNICSPLLEECEAALLGIRTSIVIGARQIVVEGDSKNVIEALKGPLEESPTEIRNCITECKELFQCFKIIKLQYANRNKNKVAHIVAKSTLKNDHLNIAIGIIPREIQKAIAEEATTCLNTYW